MTNVVEQHLSDRAVEYVEQHVDKDVQIGAMAVPPVPRKRVDEVVDEYRDDETDTFSDPLKGHLYDLTDIALAVNHAGDPAMDKSVEDDEPPYDISDASVAEIKIARGALLASFNRELTNCCERLGIEPGDDPVSAIRDELGYDTWTQVDEDWTELDDT